MCDCERTILPSSVVARSVALMTIMIMPVYNVNKLSNAPEYCYYIRKKRVTVLSLSWWYVVLSECTPSRDAIVRDFYDLYYRMWNLLHSFTELNKSTTYSCSFPRIWKLANIFCFIIIRLSYFHEGSMTHKSVNHPHSIRMCGT